MAQFFLPQHWEAMDTYEKTWHWMKVFLVLGILESLMGLSTLIILIFRGIFSFTSIISMVLGTLRNSLDVAEGSIRTMQTFGSIIAQHTTSNVTFNQAYENAVRFVDTKEIVQPGSAEDFSFAKLFLGTLFGTQNLEYDLK